MKAVLDTLASPRLTVPGLLVLGAGVAAAQHVPAAAAWFIAVPLALLALNLAAALVRVRRLRRGGLGVFHFCLLACLLLLAWGRLTHFDGRLTIVDSQAFDPAAVMVDGVGPWHDDALQRVAFRQGSFQVTYAPKVRRGHTRSLVAVGDGPQPEWHVVGDDAPLLLEGYRFYTTPNKGFAPVLTWTRTGAAPVTGALMFPSYPVADGQQMHQWEAPGGGAWKFWLQVEAVPADRAWTLDPSRARYVLVAEGAAGRFELKPGEQVQTPQGTLRYEWLSGWMGYRIFHDPTILPLLGLALLGVAGMAWHLWARGLQAEGSSKAVPA